MGETFCENCLAAADIDLGGGRTISREPVCQVRGCFQEFWRQAASVVLERSATESEAYTFMEQMERDHLARADFDPHQFAQFLLVNYPDACVGVQCGELDLRLDGQSDPCLIQPTRNLIDTFRIIRGIDQD